ncbi:MAG: class I SAM-dependent methyltransferase [Hyphomonas sp.]|nr:class I SAM-dependent methyltransferase [Hyphomonas sp.]MCB9970018.1 class I SAM-dependent methyltransferase [Hyphomonas sp.]
MTVLKQYFPKWRFANIHESSPGERGVSERLGRECRKYERSYHFHDVPKGATHPEFNARCENLEALTFPDASFDLFVTQDVLVHVLDPASALCEVSRVLKTGGAHVFTVPLVNKHQPTSARAKRAESGDILHFEDQQYHGRPTDQRGRWSPQIGVTIFLASFATPAACQLMW